MTVRLRSRMCTVQHFGENLQQNTYSDHSGIDIQNHLTLLQGEDCKKMRRGNWRCYFRHVLYSNKANIVLELVIAMMLAAMLSN